MTLTDVVTFPGYIAVLLAVFVVLLMVAALLDATVEYVWRLVAR